MLGAALPAVLREEARFRLLFAGQALSLLGDRISFVVIPFAVLSIGGIADLGLVTAAAALPFLLVAIPGGSLTDRVGRREVMLVADLVRAAVQLTMAALLISGRAEVWMLAALGACFGTAEAFFGPALNGLIPQTVPGERVQQANALLGLVANVGMVLGPTIAGLLLAVTGPGEAIGIDAMTFLISAAALSRLRVTPVAGTGDAPDPGLLAGLREGWQVVRGTGWMLPGLRALVAYHVCVLPSIFVLGPALAERDLGGATAWAAIATAFGVGAVLGSVVAYRVRFERTLVACFGAMIVACSQGLIISSGLGVPVIAVLEALSGIGVSLFFTLWDTTVQQQVPPEATARVSAYDWAAAAGLMPIGLALSSPIASAIGLETTMRLGTATGMVAALACLAVPAVRQVRRPPDPEPDYAAAPASGSAPVS